jgi:hypothetical protein
MRSTRGQGTVEYLAVVLLVALVFGGTATVASGAAGDIAAAVPREVIRGICIVRGGDCRRDLAPCDVASRSKTNSWAVTIAVVKFGHDKTVTMTQRSDGTFAVTLDTAPVGGLETGVGARGKVSLGKRSLSGGTAVTAGVTGSIGHTKTWLTTSRAAADRFIADLKDDAPMPPPDIEGHEGSLEAGVDASTASGAASMAGGLDAGVDGGWQTERATGNRTYFFSGSVGGEATASVKTKNGTASASAAGSDIQRYALTVAPDGRWIDLAVTRTGQLSGRADLPRQLAPIADALDVPTASARRWVTESHLDLTDPENLPAAQAIVAGLRDPLHPKRLISALARFSQRIEEHAVVDARTYTVDRETWGAEGHAGVELKVGGKYEDSTEKARLVAATTRGIDGRWRVREDCLKEASPA